MRFLVVSGALLAMLLPSIGAQSPSSQILQLDKEEFLRHLDQYALPDYPRKSVDSHRTGTVAAAVQVDTKGHVSLVTITTSPDVHMSEVVKTTIANWTFRPFSELGQAREAKSAIFIQFRLQPGGPHVLIPGLTKQPEETLKSRH